MLGGPEIAQVSMGYGPEIPSSMVGPVTERVIPGYTERRDALRKKFKECLEASSFIHAISRVFVHRAALEVLYLVDR